jgi:predicted transglutaminase-like cysteine proteinase
MVVSVTRQKATMLSERWRKTDKKLVESFSNPNDRKRGLEALLERPLAQDTIQKLVETRDDIQYVQGLVPEYGGMPGKGKGTLAGKTIDANFERIYGVILDVQPKTTIVQKYLDDTLNSYANALNELFTNAKARLKLVYENAEETEKQRINANAAMDNIAIRYHELSEQLGFEKNSQYKKLRNRRLKRRAVKAIREGTDKLSIVRNANTNTMGAEESWNCNKPKTTIFYNGRTLPSSDGKGEKINADVRLFVTPNDGFIQRDLEAVGYHATDPTKCDKLIMDVYRFTRTRFEYDHDEETTGQREYWMFPFELRAMRKGDCDDWANELASYLIGANIPEFRVRVVCGETRTGGGHSTVYVLDDNLSTWRHLNSTTPYAAVHGLDLKDMPTSKDRSDGIGIGQVWFSYNNKFAWHEFEGTARISYNKDKRSEVITMSR